MRHYELMVILDPSLDERTVAPSLDTFLNVIRNDGGKVAKVDIWGKRAWRTRSRSTPRRSTPSSTSMPSPRPSPSSTAS